MSIQTVALFAAHPLADERVFAVVLEHGVHSNL